MVAPLIGAAAALAARKVLQAGAKKVVQKTVTKQLTPSAKKSIAETRKALGTSKPDPKVLARKMVKDKAREMERIRKQGRNTR